MLNINCFFDTQVSDVLQHIAIFFEIGAVYIVWNDYRKRNEDLNSHSKKALITRGFGGPAPSRRKELVVAYVIGFIAILMELYQLLTQYFAC